jgi:outer membrane protein OmpA-like peptidoglycan-associated protein
MNDARRPALLHLTLAAALVAGCGPRRIAGPTRPGDELTILLVDAETGAVGRATVTTPAGSVTLDSAREGTETGPARRPSRAVTVSDSDVKRLFGDVLSALPPPPRHFTLHFRFESDELTEESRALVPEILKTVQSRPMPDVVVVGHTDTMGTPEANVELGLKRAAMVRNLLVEAGLAASAIEVTSHGEADLLVQTANDTPEPRNRRVEIAVR